MPPARPAARADLSTGRGRAVALAGTVVAALVVSVLQGPPVAQAAPMRVHVAAATAQCDMGLGRAQKGTAPKARSLMAGRANLGQYGWFRLAADPKWKPAKNLDSSGDGHMHSLHYLLPLLRRGVKTGNKEMLDRFYFLLRDWFRDNKPGDSTSRYAWGPPIYEGFRSLVLVCAAAGPRGQAPWLLKALKQNGEMAASSRRYEGINNASLHQSMGLYAIAVTVGRPAWRRLAIARERALAVRLIRPDGSDEEGALQYALNNHRWFGQAAERLRRAGDPVPAELDRIHDVPGFLAQATRPDGRLEALGDTSPQLMNPAAWVGTAAEFPASLGSTGSAPTSTFSTFAGGYVFGRSGWGARRAFSDETFFSVRAGKATPHAHDDAGSVTLYAHGSPLLVDTGQWRYTYGTTRSFVVSRAAHNAVVVAGVKRTRLRPELRTTSTGGLDIATVVDRGYAGVTLTRTVAYDRADDVLVVWDRLTSDKSVRASQQWGLGRDRDVRVDGDVAHTSGPGANVSLLFTSGGAPLDVAVGQRNPLRGWNSESYGELSPSPSLRATQRGTSLSWLTVITPRAADSPPSAVSATATVSSAAAQVALSAPGGSATVSLDAVGGARTAFGPVTAAVVPEADIVRAGTTTAVRATGLPPGEPVEFQRQAVDGTSLGSLGTARASVAGTAELTVPADVTADYRVVAGQAASSWRRVTAAGPPAVPTGVTATPSGRGVVTVSWVPPADTGGAPVTRQIVRVGDDRVTVAPGTTSVIARGVVPGPREVSVRVGNAVALSAVAGTTVDVPVHPSVSGPTKARKGTTVMLQLRGLLPGVRATVTVDPVKGRTLTRRPKARADGTATVTVRVRRTLTVVATSGGVSSREHLVKRR